MNNPQKLALYKANIGKCFLFEGLWFVVLDVYGNHIKTKCAITRKFHINILPDQPVFEKYD